MASPEFGLLGSTKEDYISERIHSQSYVQIDLYQSRWRLNMHIPIKYHKIQHDVVDINPYHNILDIEFNII